MSLDGFSMSALAAELADALTGGRIDKITQPNKQSVVFSVRQPGKNILLYINTNAGNPAAYIIETAPENPPEPATFCMVLRKQLETGRIAAVRQEGRDRILHLDIDVIAGGGRIVTRTLTLELIGKYSNIILTEDGTIVEALRRIGENSSRVRTVLKGLPYTLPPAQDKMDLLSANINDIITRVQSESEAKLFQALIGTCLGFGPVSAKEVCFMAGLAPNISVSTLDEADFVTLSAALDELRALMEQPAPSLRLDENGKVTAMAAFPLSEMPGTRRLSYPTVSALMIDADRRLGSYVIPDRERFRRLVRTELARAREKYGKLDEEIAAAENAEEQKIYADNLMTYQYQYSDHADAEITVANIYSESGEELTIPLDRRHTIIQNMQAYYKKYDKLKRARTLLAVQQERCAASIRHLESIEASLEVSARLAEIAEIREELITAGYLHEKLPKRSKDRRAQPFTFTAPDGMRILVGKNNTQNDALTFKTAAPNDIWLHVRDIPGSHVVLRTGGAPVADETLHLAAQLAAHFSKARGSSNVPVDYTGIRFVKKPAGAVPGFVRFVNEKTLFVTEDEERLKDILAQDSAL
ncbi:fibronectin-binding protein A, N-terminal domain protein [Selenomonas sp. FOBRC9]|uniref:Rqc2 family fibronectin-binding protein n=1 Tax=Selenomonas sp. FOBRC9 TaxID=936573 RepID=UPI00027A47E3|nr:NFACT RNA binding domain-containing protein [Selenomonas sp. FOBRC9]EJP33923.1 fibronectin-binding protein A, N-terminal domain protein [Selenomonas sp. FOBRC9]